jgi:hypothetical protein
VHPGFIGGSIRLAGIAGDAGTDNIFPGCGATPLAWNHMVQIQFLAFENHTAVLAFVLVPFENIVPGKLDLFFGEPIKDHQDDDPWNPDFKRNSVDAFGMWLLVREITPSTKIKCMEFAIRIVKNHVGVSLE